MLVPRKGVDHGREYSHYLGIFFFFFYVIIRKY